MATRLWRTASRGLKLLTKTQHFTVRRYILSEAFKCQNVWLERLQSTVLQEIELSDYIVQLKDKFDRENEASVIDMDILANKLHDAEDDQLEIIESLFHRFRRCKQSFPMKDSTTHAVIRSYIDLDLPDRLVGLMNDRINYGVFPDHFAASLLMDCFITHKFYDDAAAVAYELMLQEDFSNPTTRLLSLYSCIKHLVHSPPAKPEPPVKNEDEDINWVRVDWIRNHFYDDHFLIKDERFLLGKTLMVIGINLENSTIASSIKVLGSGLYNKFSVGLKTMEDVLASDSELLVECVDKFREILEEADVCDEDESDLEPGERTQEDEDKKYNITNAQKEECLLKLQELHGRLTESGKLSDASMETTVDEYVHQEIPKYEQSDIECQSKIYRQWVLERKEQLDEQIRLYFRRQKMEEIHNKLKELHEKEELLSYFENKDRITYLSDVELANEESQKQKSATGQYSVK